MDAFPDFTNTVRYALTHRAAAEGRVDIVLDLFRGAVPALTRTIARVEPTQVAPVMLKCRRYLDLRGAHAVAPVSVPSPGAVRRREEAPRAAAPMAAFDWMFAG
ncbi:hypothetical protein [Lichenibacterium ramalinae]|uniref:Uncharacterized protein n=1 Tax=Lichenibacterium ramalinae TaxID=2316527 RepID=A0A4Q2RI74_9HYPH|nr:hypothetical protein [Lichenibacterium ramalinae]RYB07674.1 hypothetical protein D3272_00635 [Lichenibacterium ramalinae]